MDNSEICILDHLLGFRLVFADYIGNFCCFRFLAAAQYDRDRGMHLHLFALLRILAHDLSFIILIRRLPLIFHCQSETRIFEFRSCLFFCLSPQIRHFHHLTFFLDKSRPAEESGCICHKEQNEECHHDARHDHEDLHDPFRVGIYIILTPAVLTSSVIIVFLIVFLIVLIFVVIVAVIVSVIFIIVIIIPAILTVLHLLQLFRGHHDGLVCI